MKGRYADMKKILLTTPVLTLIITAVLALVENVAGFVVGIIPLGMGGDCMAAVSLGGNVVMYSFPVTAAGESGGVSSAVIFNIIVFLIAFCVRTLILHLTALGLNYASNPERIKEDAGSERKTDKMEDFFSKLR